MSFLKQKFKKNIYYSISDINKYPVQMTSLNSFGRTLTNAKNAEDGIFTGGFSPELYTVANGSYASNVVYGSGAALVNTYLANQLTRGTTTVPLVGNSFVTSSTACEYRIQGNRVEFTCNVTLGGTDPDFTDADELRIRPAPRSAFNQFIGQRNLPIPKQSGGFLALFNNVEINNKSGVQVVPDNGVGPGDYQLQARLLQNGHLALVVKDSSQSGGGPPPISRALTNADIDGAFVPGTDVISITVRGEYCTSSPELDVRQDVHT